MTHKASKELSKVASVCWIWSWMWVSYLKCAKKIIDKFNIEIIIFIKNDINVEFVIYLRFLYLA